MGLGVGLDVFLDYGGDLASFPALGDLYLEHIERALECKARAAT